MKRGRKDVFSSKIEPNLSEISEMARTMSDKQISESLGIGYSTFMKYKSEKIEFREALQKGRENLVSKLKSVLIQKAEGFVYEESKTIIYPDGEERKEFYKKYCPPDLGAIHLLLKNYDRENWSNDWQTYELRKKEIELREKQVEANLW